MRKEMENKTKGRRKGDNENLSAHYRNTKGEALNASNGSRTP